MKEEKKFYLTKEGLKKLEKEYKELRRVKLARAKEDAPQILHSEDPNPEYLSFQENLSVLENRLAELEFILKNAEVIRPPTKEKQGTVTLGATVLVEMNGEMDEFKIVGTFEADPLNKKISDESPIGRALIGKRIGEIVTIKTPIINHPCRIIKIKYEQS